MSHAISSGGDRKAIGRAARAYVRAKGGSRRAARTAVAGRSATLSLGRFLADVSRRGLHEAARKIGIAWVIGKDADTVFAAVVDAIAPAGVTPEEVVARSAVLDALLQIYDRLSVETGGVERLNALDAGAVRSAVEASIVAYIYNRWLREVGIKIEQRATTFVDAARRERDFKNYVYESVRLDLDDIDVLAMDWNARESRQYVERKYVEAYRVFEGA